jgi:hypothetical protein
MTTNSANSGAVQERREEPRRALGHSFVISHYAIGQVPATSRDVSLSGLFVEGEFDGIEVGGVVNVGFRLPSKLPGVDRHREYHVMATVIRREQWGIALRFQDLELDASAALYKLMHQ